MKGSFDQTIEDQAHPEGAVRTTVQKPPGGKVLERLLLALESRGLGDVADAVVATAMPEERRPEFVAARALSTTAPAESGERRPGGMEAASTEAAAAAEDYMAAAARTGPPTASGPQWRSLGPWTIPNGQTYGTSRVNVSGRVSAIAVDPSNPAHVLCGAANGGVWESFDRGASWWPRTDNAATLTVGALVFDRRAPGIVYCGTGEGNWWSWLGAGILKSTDGGSTWSTLCTAPFVGQGFYDLIIDPAASRRLFAATNGGLYTSTNGGVTWTRRRTAPTWALSIRPAGGAAAEILAACSDGLFHSTDRGVTWTNVALPGTTPPFDRLAVSIAPSNP
jgi:hypothetical protein